MTQQRRSKRTYAALLALPAAGVLLLAGCSGSTTPEATSDGGTTGDEKVEFSLTYATSNNLESPFEVLANDYMAAHPEVTIVLEAQPNDSYGDTIRTQLQAGNAPDVLQTEAGSGQTRSIVPLAEAGFLEPLGDSSKALFPAGSDSLFTFDGEAYGQPLVLQYSGIIYNQTTADAVGVKEFPTDWKGFEALCADAAAQGKTALLLAGATVPNAGMTAMNVAATRVYAENPDWNQDRLDGKTTFADTEGWRDTLETLVALNEGGCFQAGAVGAGFDALTNGITTGLGLGFFGPLGSATELMNATPDQTFVAQAFPPASSSDKAFGIASPTYSLSINATSDKKEAAADFLAWIAEPAQASLFADVSGGLPISGVEDLDLTGTVYEPVADLIKNGDFTGLPNAQWPNAAVYDALAVGLQGLLTGQGTVDSVLASLDAAWDQ